MPPCCWARRRAGARREGQLLRSALEQLCSKGASSSIGDPDFASRVNFAAQSRCAALDPKSGPLVAKLPVQTLA
ncbi:hypothetical protein RSK20926_02789 [Roseobacter sp. SK209-2-6]|nr:hypothetical protein RSK20926_02789 [Roseobacter sp. SK209-2-6]